MERTHKERIKALETDIITVEGIKVDPKKVEAMQTCPKPTNIAELWGFLGLPRYYRKSVLDYGMIVRPLTHMPKKGPFI